MRTVAELEAFIEGPKTDISSAQLAADYLQIGNEMLEHWLLGKDLVPTIKEKEGFRILAMHRQACKGDPSFNACRETCRELAYYYNLVTMDPEHEDVQSRLSMMDMVAKHLVLFIGGKMQEAEIGEFCCSSKVNRLSREQIETRVGVNNG